MTFETHEPTVFVVDDDPGARESVAALVGEMGLSYAGYASAEEFLEEYDVKRTGCLVADVRLDGMNGLALQERLLAIESSLPVVVITAYADVPLTVRAMQNGALTLLEKPCSQHQLGDAIRQAVAQSVAHHRRHARWYDTQQRINRLTEKERQVMELLTLGKSNKEIADELHIGLRTVERRRHHILEKMQVRSLAQLSRMVAESQAAKPMARFDIG